MVVFSMIYPYVNKPKKVKMIGILAISLSGIIVTSMTAMNISITRRVAAFSYAVSSA